MQFSLFISSIAVLSVGVLLNMMVSASTTLSQSDLSVSGAALAKCDRSTIADPKYPTTGPFVQRREKCTKLSTFNSIHVLKPHPVSILFLERIMPCRLERIMPSRPTPAGWMREDLCTASSSDSGSHFVCVNMPSDFWVKTGQARTLHFRLAAAGSPPAITARASPFQTRANFIKSLTAEQPLMAEQPRHVSKVADRGPPRPSIKACCRAQAIARPRRTPLQITLGARTSVCHRIPHARGADRACRRQATSL
jgi:hypothetical protein